MYIMRTFFSLFLEYIFEPPQKGGAVGIIHGHVPAIVVRRGAFLNGLNHDISARHFSSLSCRPGDIWRHHHAVL
jgi:hypothetical protein